MGLAGLATRMKTAKKVENPALGLGCVRYANSFKGKARAKQKRN